jgi:hypothetical protein
MMDSLGRDLGISNITEIQIQITTQHIPLHNLPRPIIDRLRSITTRGELEQFIHEWLSVFITFIGRNPGDEYVASVSSERVLSGAQSIRIIGDDIDIVHDFAVEAGE